MPQAIANKRRVSQQFLLPFDDAASSPAEPGVTMDARVVPGETEARAVCFVRHRRARRYVLRLDPDGTARVTIPRGGSKREAEDFLRRSGKWLQRQQRKLEDRRERERRAWTVGATVLVRGVPTTIERAAGNEPGVQLGTTRLALGPGQTIRDALHRHLRRVASLELPERACELARELGRDIASVTVRDQRSRWGSCSPTGTISLNWRLIQMPPEVADYVIYHELAHVEHANHSRRFWRLVRRVCPWTDQARGWLRRHGTELL